MASNKVQFLGNREPAPFRVINREATRPLLLVCDHASKTIPVSLNNLGIEPGKSETHIAWDIGAAGLCEKLSEHLGATAVLTTYSRLVIDCNRRLNDPTAFVTVADGTSVPGNENLDQDARCARIENIYQPYHEVIQACLNRQLAANKTPAMLSIHSFTPVLEGLHRPWHIGVMWDRDPRIPVPLMHNLAKQNGLMIGDNEPYSGRHHWDYTVDHHAEANGLPHTVIEVRQDLLADEAAQTHWANILAEALEPVLADDALYRMEKFTLRQSVKQPVGEIT
ncbi:MAG: N-formylglutamate amidohydrolase [Gammaproteobacteria bacterium]